MEAQRALNGPGVSVFHSQTSNAFMLIAFMVGDLLLVDKTILAPVTLNFYAGLNEKSFVNLKNKILKNQSDGEFSHLTLGESIYLYMLVDLVCKCFVDDTNETLKSMASQNLKISEVEYEILRMNFLHYGQSLIEKMNEKFESNEVFCDFRTRLKGGKE